MWISDTAAAKVMVYDIGTGHLLNSFDVPFPGCPTYVKDPRWHGYSFGSHGVEVSRDGQTLFLSMPANQRIWKLRSESGEIITEHGEIVYGVSFLGSPGRRPHGLALDSTDALWCADTDFGIVARIDVNNDGRIVECVRIPWENEVHGLAYRNESLWFSDSSKNEICEIVNTPQ
jgi:hypothetical protein